MGVIAFNPMLKAGYDVRLASGVITAGGTLGILIPPSVMIIVYAAVAGQSVVKLYASAMFPGFFLALLYLIYVIGWAILDPKVAPKVTTTIPVPEWLRTFASAYSPRVALGVVAALFRPRAAAAIVTEQGPLVYRKLVQNFLYLIFPLALVAVTLWGIWWYVVIHQQAEADAQRPTIVTAAKPAPAPVVAAPLEKGITDEAPQELGAQGEAGATAAERAPDQLEEMGNPDFAKAASAPVDAGPPAEFFTWYWAIVAAIAGLMAWYYWTMRVEQFELLKLMTSSVMPLGILTIVVLAVILFGITTATESAAIGAAGAFLMGFQAKTLNFQRIKESVFLTAKTTSMVCWLFVGSALFSAVFALLGGQQLVERWVLSFNLSPVQFMIVSQAIIFVLGWPLEWTEIIVIFVPIFLPLLKHYNIDPILWGTLVFVNLQAAFLSPPVAMSAFYLKGVSPPHVTLNQIFAGMMPYMLVVVLCMVIMYVWPGMTLWLPNYLYGGGG
jgi:TRAP-type mannitol/chloroaromatic compound transport system permease large subunit